MGKGDSRRPPVGRITYRSILVIGISIILVAVIIIALATLCRAPSRYVPLNATVTFDNTQFVITNKDNFDWTNVKMEVNGGLATLGFSYHTPGITAGKTYAVSGKQFFRPDGTQLNMALTIIQRFYITCDTPKGAGSWSATWQ